MTAAAVAGDSLAFDELYRRHHEAALGVALATVRNPDDARDAVAEAFTKVFRALPEARSFRAYLLATVRNCALDIVRRQERWERAAAGDPVDEVDERQPVDRVVADEDERIVVQAFSQLPQRWQQALWLIDVEQLSTREAGSALGVSANNAAQLASRARLRLREHYLQAHVPNHIRPRCGVTVAALGSFVAGTASPRTRVKVDTHLVSCADCRARVAELRDVAGVLRRAVLPLPVLWAGRARSRGRLAGFVDRLLGTVPTSPAGRSVITLLPEASAAAPMLERLVAGTTAAVLAAGLSVLAVNGHDGGSAAQPGASPPASTERNAGEPDRGRRLGAAAGVGIVGAGTVGVGGTGAVGVDG
ncbi:MAG: sigma-70 family RNA polymerase sigma factor, partial [Acidimicrobiales bacterium]